MAQTEVAAVSPKTARKPENRSQTTEDDGFTREYAPEKKPEKKNVAESGAGQSARPPEKADVGADGKLELAEPAAIVVGAEFPAPIPARLPEMLAVESMQLAPELATAATAPTEIRLDAPVAAVQGRMAIMSGTKDASDPKVSARIELVTIGKTPTVSAGGQPRDAIVAEPVADPLQSATDQKPSAPVLPAPSEAAVASGLVEVEKTAPNPAATELPDETLPLSRLSESNGAAPRNLPTAMPLTVAQQRGVVVQVAQAVTGSEGSFEITLDPAELGNVRLTLRASETGMNVQVIAERPIAIELLRRNIAELEAEFRELGFADIGFEFSQQHQGSAQAEPPPAEDWWIETPDLVPVPAIHRDIARQVSGAAGGLDLRL